MAKPFRRIHARFPCDLPVEIHSPVAGQKLMTARLTNIGMGGAQVETEISLQRGVPYEFRLVWFKPAIKVLARVAWEAPADPKRPKSRRYGVSFSLTTQQEQAFKPLIDQLRSDHWPKDEKTARDYWSV